MIHKVLEHGIDDGIVAGIELVSVYSYVEAQPIWIGIRCQLPVLSVLSLLALSVPYGEKKHITISDKDRKEQRAVFGHDIADYSCVVLTE